MSSAIVGFDKVRLKTGREGPEGM